MPWICGVCGRTNVNTDEFPLINRCGHEGCHVEPAAYQCHHCNQLICFTNDLRTSNFAVSLDNTRDRIVRENRATKIQQVNEEREDKENQIAAAMLDARLKAISERSRSPKSLLEKAQVRFDAGYQAGMGIRAYARKRQSEAAELYKDDPTSLQESNEVIDDLLRRFT